MWQGRAQEAGACCCASLFVDLNAANEREIFYWKYEQ